MGARRAAVPRLGGHGWGDRLEPAAAAATEVGNLAVAIDVTLIDPTKEGEAVARAIAQYGAVSAVASGAQLRREVGRAKAAQEAEEAAVQAMIEQHDQERARLDSEIEKEERLGFTAAYPPSIVPDLWHALVVYLHPAGCQDEALRAVRETAGIVMPALSRGRATKRVKRGTVLALTPRIEGLEVNPPSATVAWFEDLQDVRFRILSSIFIIAAVGGLWIGRGGVMTLAVSVVVLIYLLLMTESALKTQARDYARRLIKTIDQLSAAGKAS